MVLLAVEVRSVRLVVFPVVSVAQLVQYGAGPDRPACVRPDVSQVVMPGVQASVSCCW